jgi:hypothetical protein
MIILISRFSYNIDLSNRLDAIPYSIFPIIQPDTPLVTRQPIDYKFNYFSHAKFRIWQIEQKYIFEIIK